MKFREIFRFEFLYQARRVRTWLYFAVLFVVAYLLMRTGGGGGGDVLANSPFNIAQETVLTGVLWLLMAPAVAGSAAARDVQTRMHLLIYTAPISKSDNLGGRFLAAFVLNALILLAVPLGILAALFVPGGVEPEFLAPFRPAVYLSSYGVLALPTTFTFTAVQFSVAALKRRAVVSYLGSVLFLVTVTAAAGVVTNVLQMATLGKLLDPTVRLAQKLWRATFAGEGWNPVLESHQPLRFCKPPPELLGQRGRNLRCRREPWPPPALLPCLGVLEPFAIREQSKLRCSCF